MTDFLARLAFQNELAEWT